MLLLLPLSAADTVASGLPMTSAVPASCCCLLSSACCIRLPAALMLLLSWPPELKLLLCLYAPVRLPAGARFALAGLALKAAVLLKSVLLALLVLLMLPRVPGAVALGAAAGGVQLYGLLLLLLVPLPAAEAMAAAKGDLGVLELLRGLHSVDKAAKVCQLALSGLLISIKTAQQRCLEVLQLACLSCSCTACCSPADLLLGWCRRTACCCGCCCARLLQAAAAAPKKSTDLFGGITSASITQCNWAASCCGLADVVAAGGCCAQHDCWYGRRNQQQPAHLQLTYSSVVTGTPTYMMHLCRALTSNTDGVCQHVCCHARQSLQHTCARCTAVCGDRTPCGYTRVSW